MLPTVACFPGAMKAGGDPIEAGAPGFAFDLGLVWSAWNDLRITSRFEGRVRVPQVRDTSLVSPLLSVRR